MDSKPSDNADKTDTISLKEQQKNILILQLLGFDENEKNLLKQ